MSLLGMPPLLRYDALDPGRAAHDLDYVAGVEIVEPCMTQAAVQLAMEAAPTKRLSRDVFVQLTAHAFAEWLPDDFDYDPCEPRGPIDMNEKRCQDQGGC